MIYLVRVTSGGSSAFKMYKKINMCATKFGYFIFGVPRVPESQLDRFSELGVDSNSIRNKYNYPANLLLSHKMFILLNVVTISKNLIPAYYIMSSIKALKHNAADPNARNLKFGCLELNCTSETLLRQLSLFPLHSLCNSDNQWLHVPLIDVQPIGLSLHTMYIYFMSVLNVIMLIYLYYSPKDIDAHLFSMLPEASIKLSCDIIRKILSKTYLSMINLHTQCPRLLCATQLMTNGPTNTCDSYNAKFVAWAANSKVHNVYFEQRRLSKFNVAYVELDQSAHRFIDDCLTLFRSTWWHRKSARVTFIGIATLVLATVACTIVGFIFLHLAMKAQLANLIDLIDQLNSSGCAIRGQNGVPLTSSILIANTLNWSVANFIELSLTLLSSLCFSGIIFSWYQQALFDLWSMVLEQMDRICMAIEITKQLNAADLNSVQAIVSAKLADNLTEMYSFAELKKSHMRKLKSALPFKPMTTYEVSSGNQPAPATMVGAELVRSNGLSVAAYQELLTKIYVSNGYLIKAFLDVNHSVGNYLVILFAVTYGFIVILIYVNRNFKRANEFTLVMGLWSIGLNSTMVLLPSKVHSTSKQLVILMWRLMVANIEFEDMRVKYLRVLMLKQLESICHHKEGGLSLKVFGIPLTYGFVIKLSFWSATMIVISFTSEVVF